MKQKMALLALAFIMAFSMTANVSAATTTVSLTSISMGDAYLGNGSSQLNVSTSPGQIYLAFRVDNGGQWFTLNSVSIDIAINGQSVSSESYSSYIFGNKWNLMGSYDTNTYTDGLMNQGLILVGWGNRNPPSSYSVSLNPGDTWQATMTYDVQGQGPITSTATVTFVPEPTSCILAALSTIVFLRRKR